MNLSTGPRTVLEGSNRVILLDRDGVLNVDRPDSVTRTAELDLESGAVEGCRLLHDAGFALAVVTNQSAVARGLMDPATLGEINADLNRQLGGLIDRWYVCPHGPDDGCRCRKPGTLLLEQARTDLGFDPVITWLVGDAARDIEAAHRFGCLPALLLTGKGAATAPDFPAVPTWPDLAAFARQLVAGS